MKRAFVRTFLLAVCLSLVPLGARAQKVSVDYDKDVDFSKFHTYAWQMGRSSPNPLIDKRIVAAIDRHLGQQGWMKDESAPGAIVIYHAGVGVERQLNAWGTGPRWNGYGHVTTETIYTGQVVVDIHDVATGDLIWRGVASDTISDRPEKNDKRLNDAIAKLFKHFPPARAAATK
jgi:uncharacterized protein DUF4136